ncbi:MAG: transglycosylase SLT domain-containing protein [Pseudomonadota bacterium]|jgi:soluble lytic murein transglycosylase-like protein|nr:transglycosylase SLT domain-containing protein [Alphaproteobacteria bacterium]
MQSNWIGRFFLPLLVTVSNLAPVSATFAPKKLNKMPKRTTFSKRDCQNLIKQLERENSIPPGLLEAIGAVESDHTAYAVNCKGQTKHFTNYEVAKQHVLNLRSQGIIDIDIGMLQINYGYHRSKFKAEELLDPYNNASYAAQFLVYLKKVHGTWEKAVKFYHSPAQKYQKIYFTKVMAELKQIDKITYQQLANTNVITLKPARKIKKAA